MTSVVLMAIATAMTSGRHQSRHKELKYNEKNNLSVLFSSFCSLGGSVGGEKYASPAQ